MLKTSQRELCITHHLLYFCLFQNILILMLGFCCSRLYTSINYLRTQDVMEQLHELNAHISSDISCHLTLSTKLQKIFSHAAMLDFHFSIKTSRRHHSKDCVDWKDLSLNNLVTKTSLTEVLLSFCSSYTKRRLNPTSCLLLINTPLFHHFP